MADKLSSMQREFESKRQDYEYDRTNFHSKLGEMTAELQTYKANNRIHEERQKLMEAERVRLDKRF